MSVLAAYLSCLTESKKNVGDTVNDIDDFIAFPLSAQHPFVQDFTVSHVY